jgi:hypothetical protein
MPLVLCSYEQRRLTIAFLLAAQSNKPIKLQRPFPMNFHPRTSASRQPANAGGTDSHVVPVRDVQWERPVFRPPELPAYPRLFNTVPFTAMRPLRPTRPGKPEMAY